jgi:acyl-CoA thioesterase I
MRILLLCLLLVLMPPAGAASQARILVVGDSISGAYGMATEDGWVALLQERLRAEGYPHEVINASVSGATTSSARSRLADQLERHEPDVVILQLGGNDGLRGLSLDAMAANLDAMVTLARDADARVLLAAIRLPPNYGTAYLDRFRAAYETVADTNEIAYVPRILAGFENRRDLMLDDQIHPNEAGQAVILDNVWPQLEPLLRNND